MKIVLFIAFVLSLLALTSAQSYHCCTVNQWSALINNWDPMKEFFAFGDMAYDFTNNREFFTAIEHENGTRVNVTYIMLWASNKYYRIFTHLGRAQCHTFPLFGKMQPYCVPSMMMLRGNYTIGGTLSVNVYEWMGGDSKGHVQVSSDGCVPVKSDVFTMRNPNADTEEYFDWVPAVNPSIFTPPSYC